MSTELVRQSLTPAQRTRKAELEAIIEANLDSFLKCGGALSEIRAEQLYFEGFDTFEDYCRDRWNISARRSAKLIKASNDSEPEKPSAEQLRIGLPEKLEAAREAARVIEIEDGPEPLSDRAKREVIRKINVWLKENTDPISRRVADKIKALFQR